MIKQTTDDIHKTENGMYQVYITIYSGEYKYKQMYLATVDNLFKANKIYEKAMNICERYQNPASCEHHLKKFRKQFVYQKSQCCGDFLPKAYAFCPYCGTELQKNTVNSKTRRIKCKQIDGIKIITDAVQNALGKYNSDNIDVVLNEETGFLDIMYHNYHNSFAVFTGIISSEKVDLKELEKELDTYDIGHVW